MGQGKPSDRENEKSARPISVAHRHHATADNARRFIE
jgi:hypothetical protein